MAATAAEACVAAGAKVTVNALDSLPSEMRAPNQGRGERGPSLGAELFSAGIAGAELLMLGGGDLERGDTEGIKGSEPSLALSAVVVGARVPMRGETEPSLALIPLRGEATFGTAVIEGCNPGPK